MLSKIIAIAGMTATGKSDFAVEVARICGGEIISADSRQVYKGLDIGTGKITKKEMRGVPHHLLDVASPKRVYSADAFKKDGERAIAGILSRKKTPIICGGTGFYIDTLLKGIQYPDVPPNEKLRALLAKRSAPELLKILKEHDTRRARTIDPHNKARLIRAIEIAKHLGAVPKASAKPKWQSLTIGLAIPRDALRDKIEARLAKRMKAGMLGEAKRLHANGLSWKRMEALGLEYRYEARHLQGKISKRDMLAELASEICKYAKRQETWFKRDKSIIWIDPRKKADRAKAIKQIQAFLEK